MIAKDLKEIPINIDCEQTFKNANALLKDGWKFGSLVGFKKVLKRHFNEEDKPLIYGLGADYTISGKNEYMPIPKRALSSIHDDNYNNNTGILK